MSIQAVSFSQVVCDGCGAEFAPAERTVYKGATAARIAASRDGWKFAEYPEHKRNLPGPRMWDACPDCPLPATSAEAQAALLAQGKALR